MSRPARMFFLVLALTAVLFHTAAGQQAGDFSFVVRPHLATDTQRWTVGLRYDAQYRREGGAVHAWFYEAGTGGRLLVRPRLNTEPLVAAVAGGAVFNLIRFDADDVLPLPGADGPINPDSVPARPLRDYGRLDVGFTARYEASQTFDDQQITGGLEVGYVNIRTVGGWGWVPSAVLSADVAFPLTAGGQAVQNDDEEPFVRLRAVATLAPRIGEVLPVHALKPLGLHLLGEGHWAPWEDGGRAAGLVSATLFYAVNQRLRFLDQVYVRFARGRIPPSPFADTTWTIGLVAGFGPPAGPPAAN